MIIRQTPFPYVARHIDHTEWAVAFTFILSDRSRFANAFAIDIVVTTAGIPFFVPRISTACCMSSNGVLSSYLFRVVPNLLLFTISVVCNRLLR